MRLLERLVNGYAPHYCLLCDQPGSPVCEGCWPDVASSPNSACYACGVSTKNFATCRSCSAPSRPAHAWSAAEYGGVVELLIKGLKYGHRRAYAPALGSLLAEAVPYGTHPVVCAVPTTTARKRQRGYDHAVLIARELARQRGWRFTQVLIRLDQTHQVGSNRSERTANPITHRVIGDVQGKAILLVDDVLSTGSSVEAATRALIAAGAAEVSAATVAINRVKNIN